MSQAQSVEVTTHNLHFHDQASIYAVDSRGPVLATAGGDADVRVWEVEQLPPHGLAFCHTNALTASVRIHFRHTLSAHTRAVNCVRFGDEFLASSSDGGHVVVWDAAALGAGVAQTVRHGDGDDVYDVAWHRTALFVGHASGNVSVFDVARGTAAQAPAVPREDDAAQKRAKVAHLGAPAFATVRLVQTLSAHADIVQGLAFNAFHGVLATQSRDRSFRTFCFRDGLVALGRGDVGDGRAAGAGRSFFKRAAFAHRDLLFLAGCSAADRSVVLVYAFPFRDLHARIGPFDSAVQRIAAWGERVAVVTRRSLYVVCGPEERYAAVLAISDVTLRQATDACVADGLLVISSMDGFLSSVRLGADAPQ